MDALIQRFLVAIGIKDLAPFQGASFKNLRNDPDNNRIIATILLDHMLDYQDYEIFFSTISDFASHGGFGIKLDFAYHDEEVYFPRVLEEFKEANKTTLMDNVHFNTEEKKIIFFYKEAAEAAKLNEETRKLKDFLDSITSHYQILTQEEVYIDNSFSKERDEKYKEISRQAAIKFKEDEERLTKYQPCRLKDIENYRLVIVEGKIFKAEDQTLKNGRNLRKIEFTDGSDSIAANLFETKSFPMEEVQKYKVETKIKVTGSPEINKFTNKLELRVSTIEIQEPDPIREDTYPRKRVELHLHTRMSSFDGVNSIGDFAKTAKRWGHKAIAITDHGVVQSYPEAQQAFADTGVKMLYGAELYVVNDRPTFIYNPKARILAKDTYVVFDTETLGLSSRYGRLIEFGAVRIDASGQVLEQKDFFINPQMKLNRFAIEVSHIRQEDVDHGLPIQLALKQILEFFGDSTLVAHNASFDYGFINEALKNNGLPPISNPVIDTLPIARYLYPDMRSHREEALARRMDIDFESETAHRADYDASHLAQIFSVMLSQLTKEKADFSQTDLSNLPVSKQMLLSEHPFHVVVLAKNMDGLKDLYKIISQSNTRYLKDSTPICPRAFLEENRKNLLIGSGCFSGEVFEAAMNKSKEDLIRMMEPYDYIEVQPPANYLYLIQKGELNDFDEVKKILKDLIMTAKEAGKIVCATGDCHYVEPKDKIFRDVYIASKGIKGARHPMNLAPYENQKEARARWAKHPLDNPDQEFRTTNEMIEAFSFLDDVGLEEEIVIDNTNKIADMVSDDVRPTKKGTFAPHIEGCEDMLSDLVYKTAKKMYGDPLPKLIADRLDVELHGIIDNGFSVIYWLSSMIVRWSNQEGYLIGSRGSVGSSLVATFSGITEVNPLPPHYLCPHCHYLEWADLKVYESGFDLPAKKCPHCGHDLIGDGQNIPFATFLGFHAEKTPDIDLNFPSDFQSLAHEHMKEELNRTGNTSYKAGTIQTTQDKQAYGYAKGYYESREVDPETIRPAQLDYISTGCIGTKRSTGQHPGGVIVIPKGYSAYDFTPVQYPADDPNSSWMTTHYDFHAIHDNVLKFDMLGHVDPQAVKMQCDMCGIPFTKLKEMIPISDPKAMSLFWSPEALNLKKNVLQQETGALGLPEFGTVIGRRTLHETQPRSFADLVRISGLSHGTNVYGGNAQDLIMNEGKTLKDVIACRDDIMTVLHETYGVDNGDAFQIMEFTRKGNFGKPGGDEKKAKFEKIMRDHNVPDWYIESCKKIAYMFPKGHAVAYVTNCIRCAWFKVYHPLEYYATYFTLRCDAYDIQTMLGGMNACLKALNVINAKRFDVSKKEKDLINTYEQCIEMFDRGYKFGNLDINLSQSTMFIVDHKRNVIVPSFSTIDGVASSAGDQIVLARKEHPFTSVEDLRMRGRCSDKVIDALRSLHALDTLPESDQMTLF